MTTAGPDLELQSAINTTLLANSELKAMIGDPPRIYVDAPEGKNWPGAYLTFGASQEIDDSVSQQNASVIFPTVHAWSRTSTFTEVKKLAAIVKNAIHGATLSFSENRFVLIELDRIDTMPDPDGVTKHAAITFRALTNNP